MKNIAKRQNIIFFLSMHISAATNEKHAKKEQQQKNYVEKKNEKCAHNIRCG